MMVSATVIGDKVPYKVYSAQSPGVMRGHKDFAMSRGELMNFASNPRRWKDGYREEESDTDATKWGSMIECLAGLNGDFSELYAVAPETYPDSKTGEPKPWNWNATFCKDWREEQGEREVIKSDLQLKAEAAHEALRSNSDVCGLFDCSRKQVMVVGLWRDGTTGIEIPLRCLLDLVPSKDDPAWGKSLGDFKTARDGNPDSWDRVVNSSGYDIQAALSLMLYTKATGEDRTDWVWPVQENVHPYHVVSPMPSASIEFLKWGRLKIESWLAEYARCLSSGNWPSYSTGNRIVIDRPHVQIIGPESIYAYRESGGIPPMLQSYQPELKKEPVELTPYSD